MRALGIIITVPLVFFIPGYAVFRSRLFSEYRMDWLVRVLLVICLSVSATSLVALFLAEAGHLSLWLLDIILACLAAGVRLAFGDTKRRLFAARPRAGEAAVVIVLCLLAVLFFFRPFEYVAGDGDPGYYFNNGYNIASTGSVNVIDESVGEMSDAELKTFFSKGISQFIPFHLRARQTGKIQPLLYHLLPVWIGIFIMLFGTWGGLFVAPLFALLSVVAVFALARRFTGLFGATAGAALLCVFFPQFYFAREPASEIFCQFFVVVAALFLLEFLRTRGIASALAGAGAATAAAAVRPEALILPVLMLAVMFGRMFLDRYRAGDFVFVNALLLGLLYLWFYMLVGEYSYLASNMSRVISLFGSHGGMRAFLTFFLVAIGVCFVIFNLWPLQRRMASLGGRALGALERRASWAGRAAKGAMAATVLLAFIFFYFVSPHRAGLTASSPQKFFFYTAAFFGGVAVFIFVAGLCLLILESDRPGFSFLLAAGVVAYTLAFTESSVTAGYQPWLLRRYIPLVVPALFIGFSYLAGRLWETRKPAPRTAAALVVAGFLALFLCFAAPVFNHVEYRGINRQLEELASKLDEDVVIFTRPFTGEAFGIPLRYQHGVDARRAYTFEQYEAFEEIITRYSGLGRGVLIEAGGLNSLRMDPRILDSFAFRKAFEYTISFPRLSKSYVVRPVRAGTEKHDLTFFYVTPRNPGASGG